MCNAEYTENHNCILEIGDSVVCELCEWSCYFRKKWHHKFLKRAEGGYEAESLLKKMERIGKGTIPCQPGRYKYNRWEWKEGTPPAKKLYLLEVTVKYLNSRSISYSPFYLWAQHREGLQQIFIYPLSEWVN